MRASVTGEVDFATFSYLAAINHWYPGPSGKDAVARRSTLRCRINCPALLGELGSVGISPNFTTSDAADPKSFGEHAPCSSLTRSTL